MEKEELKGIIREVLEEFLRQLQAEWERYWIERVGLLKEKKVPPPPYWYLPMSRSDLNELRQTVSTLQEISESYKRYWLKLESWEPECSEKQKIDAIETSIKNIERSVADIKRILSELLEKSK